VWCSRAVAAPTATAPPTHAATRPPTRPPTRPVTRAGRARTAVAGPGAASVVLVVPVAGYFACGWARTTVLMILSAMVWRLVSHSGNSQPT